MRFTTIAFALGAVSVTVIAALPMDFDSDLYARDWEDSDDLYSREQGSKDLVARARIEVVPLGPRPPRPKPSPAPAPPPPPPPPQITTSVEASHHARSWYESDLYARGQGEADRYEFIETIPIVQVPQTTGIANAQASRVTPKAKKAHHARGWDDSASRYGHGRGSNGHKVMKKILGFDSPQPTASPVPTEYPHA